MDFYRQFYLIPIGIKPATLFYVINNIKSNFDAR